MLSVQKILLTSKKRPLAFWGLILNFLGSASIALAIRVTLVGICNNGICISTNGKIAMMEQVQESKLLLVLGISFLTLGLFLQITDLVKESIKVEEIIEKSQ